MGKIIINTDLNPNPAFRGARIEYHKKMSKITLDLSKLEFYFSDKPQNHIYPIGNEIQIELESKNIMNACVLDFLLSNSHLIPESWKKDENGNARYIFFWGTIFRTADTGGFFVSYLYFNGNVWKSDSSCLGGGWMHRVLVSLSVK